MGNNLQTMHVHVHDPGEKKKQINCIAHAIEDGDTERILISAAERF